MEYDQAMLFLDGKDHLQAEVHPVTLFSILDHFIRRTDGQERVIGTLLGHVTPAGNVEVTNCFPVPHSETEETMAINADFHAQLMALYRKVNSKEKIVGW